METSDPAGTKPTPPCFSSEAYSFCDHNSKYRKDICSFHGKNLRTVLRYSSSDDQDSVTTAINELQSTDSSTVHTCLVHDIYSDSLTRIKSSLTRLEHTPEQRVKCSGCYSTEPAESRLVTFHSLRLDYLRSLSRCT